MVFEEIVGGGRSGGGGAGGFRHLAWKVYRGRWFMVFASSLMMAASGSTYIFGLYSNVIKSTLGYDQTTINLLSFFKDTGTNVGVISGLINEVAPPWVVISIGAAMNFAGYFMTWCAVTGRISRPRVWQMCLYLFIGANSQTFSDTGALATGVKNFPENRGVVLGFLNGFIGLSGAIVTQIYHALYGDDSQGLILLIACLPTAIYLCSLHTIRIIKVVKEVNELKMFYGFLYISLGLASYLTVITILQKLLGFSRAEYGGSAVVVTVLVFSPLLLIVKEEIRGLRTKKQQLGSGTSVEMKIAVQELIPTPTTTVSPQISCWSRLFEAPKRGDDFTILQALVSGDMLILFVASICGIGGTTAMIDNLGQIGSTLGYSNGGISTFISLVSIWSYLGRVGSGFGSEILLTRYRFPRTLMLTLILLLSCVGHLLVAFPFPGSVFAASLIIGFSLGAQWSLLFAIISEIFGLKYYSTLSNFGSLASPVGSYVLNVRVVGYLYDREAETQMSGTGLTREAGQDLSCSGVHCYRLAFVIIAAVTFFGSLVSLVLVWRTRDYYKSDIYKKFRESAVPAEPEIVVARNSIDREMAVQSHIADTGEIVSENLQYHQHQ